MPKSDVTIVDGSTDWSGGVDSIAVPTIAGPQVPDGLQRNELAWLINGTVRDGGITPRSGFKFLGMISQGNVGYQGGIVYKTALDGLPYLVLALGGQIYQVNPDNASQPVNLSTQSFAPRIIVPGVTVKASSTGLNGQLITIDPTSIAATQFNLSSGWTMPAIGSSVFIPTTTNYTGPVNVTIPLHYSFKVISVSDAFPNSLAFGQGNMVLQNVAAPPGAPALGSPNVPFENTGWAYNGFIAPAIGANVTIQITRGGMPHSPKQPLDTPPQPGTILHFYFGSVVLVSVTTANNGGTGINPANLDSFFFAQAEEFLIIQAGDYVTPALIWDGLRLRRSIGITNTLVASGTPGVNEIPPAGPMDYFEGRLWYAQGRQYSAGDVVGGPSGSSQYNLRDSLLNVTENPLAVGGDGFRVPSEAGNIRALFHSANIDTTLGQGNLYIGTRKSVFSLNVPVSRTNWIGATSQNQPLQTVIQINNGPVGDKSVVLVNGDVFYQSIEPSIRSLIISSRFFGQWGNRDISTREHRVLSFADRSVLRGVSGVNSDNRLLMSTMPRATAQGIVSDGIIPCDFVPISDFHDGGAAQPAWEGLWEGISVLQLFTADFGGLERTFAVAQSKVDSSIQLWEISDAFQSDLPGPLALPTILATGQQPENRITMIVETPAFTWDDIFELKELLTGELWFDRIFGESVITVEYRQDSDSCWHMWSKFKVCQPRNTAELTENPISYPIQNCGPGFKQTITLPKPQEICESQTSRPTHIGYQFQVRLTVKGYLRIRAILLHAARRVKELYDSLACPP